MTCLYKRCMPFLIIVIFCMGSAVTFGSGMNTTYQGDANGYAIVINLPARQLHLYHHGIPVKTYPIGVGNIVSPSRLGSTQIINKVSHPTYYPTDWYTRGLNPIPPGPDNPVGTRWLGLGWSGYGIHGTNNPQSIGTAASAGCIRMYNADVEELSDIVSIGTPVTFVYETVEVWRDALTGHPLVKIHPDVYGMNTSSIQNIRQKLAEQAIPSDRLSHPGMAMLTAQARGEVSALPIDLPVFMDGTHLIQAGFQVGTQRLVSLHRLAEHMSEDIVLGKRSGVDTVNGHALRHSVWIEDELYAEPEEAVAALGLGHRRTSVAQVGLAEEFYPVMIEYEGTRLASRAILDRYWLLVSLEAITPLVQADIVLDTERDLVVIDGKPTFLGKAIGKEYYLPHDRLPDLVGLEVEWQPGNRRARLRLREEAPLPLRLQESWPVDDGIAATQH